MNSIEKASNTSSIQFKKFTIKRDTTLINTPQYTKLSSLPAHFFRAAAMFGFMMWMPTSLPVTIGIMVAGSLLYRAAVERFCCFRFTIPSLVGAGAAWLAHLTRMNIASNAALASLGIALHALAFLPLLGYAVGVIYLSHRDVENRMKQLKLAEQKTPVLVAEKRLQFRVQLAAANVLLRNQF